MSLNKIDIIDNGHPAVKKPVIFGSAIDLAHIYNKEWAINNFDLLVKTDEAFDFIYSEILIKKTKRNLLENFIFKRKVKQARFSLNLFIRELRGLVCEVEALIGFNSYLREGKKSKIKNKKVYDDHITERREISIMLQGLLLFLDTNQACEIDFSNEISIMEEIRNKSAKVSAVFQPKYFISTSSFLVTFTF